MSKPLSRAVLAAVLLFTLSRAAAAASASYCLGSRDGRLVWCDLENKTWHETSMLVSQLPNAADRAAVLRGIPVCSRAALSSILEDFCS